MVSLLLGAAKWPHQLGTLLALTGVLTANAAASAQSVPGDTLHLTLKELLARVDTVHPTVLAGLADIRAAEARAAQLRRYPNPSLDLERVSTDGVDNIALLQPIRWPRESRALNGIGQAGVAVTRAAAERDRQALRLEAALRMVDALRDARVLTLEVEEERIAGEAVERVRAARQLGQVGDLVVLQLQVSLDAVRRARAAAESELHTATSLLAVLLGLAPSTSLDLEGELDALGPIASADVFGRDVNSTDPEALRLAAETELAVQEGRLARARKWPELAVGPAVSVGPTTSVGLSIGLGIPLWNQQNDAIRVSSAEQESAVRRRQARQQELSVQTAEAQSTVERAATGLCLLRGGQLARAEQAMRLAERALQQGGPYMTTWLATRQAYLDARRSELDLEWQGVRARLLLRHLSGTLRPEEVE